MQPAGRLNSFFLLEKPVLHISIPIVLQTVLFLLAILVISGLQTWCSVTETSKAVYREMGTMYSDVLNGKISLEEMDQYILELQEQLLAEGTSGEDKMKQNILTVVDLVYVAVSLAMSFLADYLYKKKCKKDILSIDLKPEIVDPDDIETLTDILTAGVNEAIKRVETTNAEEMSKITGAMGSMPGLF